MCRVTNGHTDHTLARTWTGVVFLTASAFRRPVTRYVKKP